MNRQEVLHGLNNAVTLFKQQETLSQEYERVQQKDRPYEEKRKIGWLGIIILGFEIVYIGPLTLSPLIMIADSNAEDMKMYMLYKMDVITMNTNMQYNPSKMLIYFHIFV